MHPLQWDLNLDCSELTPGFDLSIKDNPAVSAPLCHWLFSFNAVRSAHTTEWSCKPWLPCCQIVIIQPWHCRGALGLTPVTLMSVFALGISVYRPGTELPGHKTHSSPF